MFAHDFYVSLAPVIALITNLYHIINNIKQTVPVKTICIFQYLD